jgi:hypothetical protein
MKGRYLKLGHDHFFPEAFTNIHPVVLRYCIVSATDGIIKLIYKILRVLGYRSGGPGSIPGTTRKKK